ncbi:hypothetical protein ALC60_13570 [Trachymyrmex zeteki]|uniref:Uncharacterized protein n=1 Tax=Mycetomoellerius zeteki TaxID=64791 RepID=A0A151WHW7_9HYME|nr:hypothetical protein ALC60_13570 [Trachymyrmex zeteki]
MPIANPSPYPTETPPATLRAHVSLPPFPSLVLYRLLPLPPLPPPPKKERDEGNTAEKAKSGSPRHVNDRPGVNCGGGSLVVSGDDSEHKHGKYFRKHAVPKEGKLVKYFRHVSRHDRKVNDGKLNE